MLGVFMISMALLCDAVIGNVQEKSMKTYQASNTEVVLYSYGIGFLYLLVILLGTGQLSDGVLFFAKVSYIFHFEAAGQNKYPFQNPRKIYGYAIIFSLTGYFGTQVVLTLVKTCGAFAAVTVTTCRKAMTMILSFIFFSKPFTFQ